MEIKPMHYEDAIKFLIERLKEKPDAFYADSRTEFDVYIPRAVTVFLFEQTGDRNLFNLERCREETHRPTWIAFYDAASELCRRGIFRQGRRLPMGFGEPAYELEERYSITVAGHEWLKNSTTRYVPTAPAAI
jgi:hypothetical protein